MRVYDSLVREGLAELSDRQWQMEVWAGGDPNRISSLLEAFHTVFTDSGLDEALGAGPVFGGTVDQTLRRLAAQINDLDLTLPFRELDQLPEMSDIRDTALQALNLLNAMPLQNRTGRPLPPR